MNTDKEPGFYRYYVLALLTLTYLFSFMDRQILSILIEDIGKDFQEAGITLTDTHKGLLMGPAFGMFYATLGIPIARLADRASRKNIIAAAITLWSAATAACSLATGFGSLFFARMMVGVGEAGGTAPAHSLLSDYFKKSEISRAIAIFSMGTSIGLTIALMAGGWIADQTSWRVTFIIAAIPGIVVGALIFFTVKEPKRGRYEPNYNPDAEKPAFFETLKQLLRCKPYLGTVFSHAAAVFMTYIIVSWGAVLFIRNFEISKTEVGMLLGPAVIMAMPGVFLGGFLADKLGKRDSRWMGWICTVGCFLCIPAFLAAVFIEQPMLMAAFFGIGLFCHAIAHAPSLSIIQAVLPPHQRAIGAAFTFLMSNVFGLIIGPPLAGWLSASLQPTYGALSLNYAFAILLVSMLIAGIGFIWTGFQMKGYKIGEAAHAH